MASFCAFPSPCPSFEGPITVERQPLDLSPAAVTARLLDSFNPSPKRSSVDEQGGGPNKKAKCVQDDVEDDVEDEFDVDSPDKPPVYPPHMKRKPVVFEVDKCVPGGIVSFLSSKKKKKKKRDFLVRFNGDRVPVTSLLGKHLIICAFLLPLRTGSQEANVCRAFIASYKKLSNLHNFEMVMVARMRDRADFSSKEDEEAAFNHFFSAFPCLAVPFSDSHSRDFICRSLDLTTPDDFMFSFVVDDKQVVLHLTADFFLHFGALFFPFTRARLKALCTEANEWKMRLDPLTFSDGEIDQVSSNPSPPSLAELLGCQPSDFLWKTTTAWEGQICGGAYSEDLLIKCCPRNDNNKVVADGGDEVVSVFDLSQKKVVGLYLCIDGIFMAKLYEVHQQCLARGLEFEVVLVFLPFSGDFASFFHDVKLALEKLEISSWWVAPYNDESSRRLWRLCGLSWSDKLFILDAASKVGDLEGRGVINNLGGIEAYPFTKQSLVEKTLSRLRSITLASLFDESAKGVDNIFFREQGAPRASHVSELKGKSVLLYIDYYGALSSSNTGDMFEILKECYDGIRKAYPNSEVLFVPFDSCMNCCLRAPSVPWLSLHPSAAASVIERVFWDGRRSPRFVAFGEDGLLRCRRARKHLTEAKAIDSLFADSLREETVLDVFDTLSVGDD